MVADPENSNPYLCPKTPPEEPRPKKYDVSSTLLVGLLLLSMAVIVTVPIISFPAAIVAGWTSSRLRNGAARVIGFAAAVVAITLLIGLALTGWQHEHETAAYVHRWTAHGTTILVWVGAPYSIGVLLRSARGALYDRRSS